MQALKVKSNLVGEAQLPQLPRRAAPPKFRPGVIVAHVDHGSTLAVGIIACNPCIHLEGEGSTHSL